MTSLIRNSALCTLATFATGKTPTFSRAQLNVKDIERAAEDPLETPPPERETPSDTDTITEKDRQATNSSSDELIVTWNGKDDPDNPQNWPVGQKIWITLLIRFVSDNHALVLMLIRFTVCTPSPYTPARPSIRQLSPTLRLNSMLATRKVPWA